MSFDIKKFKKTKFEPRTEEVPLLALQDFFPPGAPPVWKVRGLTGQELGQVNEAAERNKNLAAVIEGLLSPDQKTKADAVRELVGVAGETTPREIARRIALLSVGSVDPPVDEEAAVKFCQVFPVEFYLLTNKITELTGLGHLPGKPRPSGETATSGQPSPFATPEGASSSK